MGAGYEYICTDFCMSQRLPAHAPNCAALWRIAAKALLLHGLHEGMRSWRLTDSAWRACRNHHHLNMLQRILRSLSCLLIVGGLAFAAGQADAQSQHNRISFGFDAGGNKLYGNFNDNQFWFS